MTLIIPSLSANQALGFIASKAGIFRQNGLDVKSVNAGSGALAVAALVSGSGQFTITGGADLFGAEQKGQHLQVRAKAMTGQATQLDLTNAAVKKIEVSPSAPLAQRIKALGGLTIASPSAASSWTAQAKKAAATEGATLKFTYIQPPDMAAAIKQNGIDGIVAAPPFTTDPVFAKTGVVWLSGPAQTFPGGYDNSNYGDPLVATTQSYAQSNPSVVKAFTKSILQAGAFAAANPSAAGADLKAATFRTMANAEWQQVWTATLPLLKTPAVTLAELKTTLQLDGFGSLNASDLYPASILTAVNSGS